MVGVNPGQGLGAMGPQYNLTSELKLPPHMHIVNRTNMTNGTQLLDVEEDTISPGFAILLMYLMLVMIIGAQTGLLYWKNKHKRSYELVSLAGLWLVPAAFSAYLQFWRFILVWVGFSLITGYLYTLCSGKRLHHSTPYKVYTWFLGVYWVSRTVGIAGYVLLILDMFGVGLLLSWLLPPGTSLLLLWYGLYFGILGRDCAEVASDQMASVMGSGSKLTSTVHNCGICGGELKDYSHLGEEAPEEQRVRQLNCKHCFHELCVRGWTIVGKKDVCPVCLEKVDLKDLYADKPWETRNLSWIQMLDSVRYMIVWNPLIFLAFSVLARFAPHVHVVRHITVAAGMLMAPPGPGNSTQLLNATAAAAGVAARHMGGGLAHPAL